MEHFLELFVTVVLKVGLLLIECSINFPDGISTFSLLSELIEFLNRQFQNHSSAYLSLSPTFKIPIFSCKNAKGTFPSR